MATIRRGSAVARMGPFRFTGFPAWLVWLLVHLMLRVGFRNQVFVFFEWFWAYLTTQPRARLILNSSPRPPPLQEGPKPPGMAP